MEPITTAILARGIYELLQAGISWSKGAIEEKLRTFISDEAKAAKLAVELQGLEVDDEMSAKAIERKIDLQPEVLEILKSIKPEERVSINQIHTGSGDNVGRDKNVRKG